jgi:hypothetical protein
MRLLLFLILRCLYRIDDKLTLLLVSGDDRERLTRLRLDLQRKRRALASTVRANPAPSTPGDPAP